MARHLIGVDSGNGFGNAVAKNLKNGRVTTAAAASMRAIATGASLGASMADNEALIETVRWFGQLYAVGDDVLKYKLDGFERHLGRNRAGNDLQDMITAYLCVKCGVRSGDQVEIAVFSPPGLFADSYAALAQTFKGERTIQIGKSKPVTFSYDRAIVLPEGFASALCYLYNTDGTPVESDALEGNCAFIDSGYHTLDVGHLVDGLFNPNDLAFMTFEKGGVRKHILEPILLALRKRYAHATAIQPDEIDRVIRRGQVTGDYLVFVGPGAKRDDGYISIEPLVKSARRAYADWIANHVIDDRLDGLVGFNHVYCVGGGMYGVADHLADHYRTQSGYSPFLSQDQIVARIGRSRVAPENMNAVAGLIYLQVAPEATI